MFKLFLFYRLTTVLIIMSSKEQLNTCTYSTVNNINDSWNNDVETFKGPAAHKNSFSLYLKKLTSKDILLYHLSNGISLIALLHTHVIHISRKVKCVKQL